MDLPSICTVMAGPRYGLALLNESLVLLCYPDSMCEINPANNLLDIWMMKEYGDSESWIKIYTINPVPTPCESPLAYLEGSFIASSNPNWIFNLLWSWFQWCHGIQFEWSSRKSESCTIHGMLNYNSNSKGIDNILTTYVEISFDCRKAYTNNELLRKKT